MAPAGNTRVPFDNPWSGTRHGPTREPISGSVCQSQHVSWAQRDLHIAQLLSVRFIPITKRNGRTYTWNASIEHQFGNNWLAKVAYVASESDHVPYQQNIDLARQSAVQSSVPVHRSR